MLRRTLALAALALPLASVEYFREDRKEAALELFEVKRKSFKLYKMSGDVRHMNRGVVLTD